MKQEIIISEKFFDKLQKEYLILNVYGYVSPEEYLKKLMEKLNETYEFFNISGYNFLNKDEEKIYKTFNGYIKGDFTKYNYDEINISFTDIHGKEGNTFLAQQFIPLITNKIKEEPDYLLNDRILKIGVLTTHKSNIFNKASNISNIGSSIENTIKCANTLGYQFINMFPILGINKDARYYNVEEFLSHLDILKSKNKSNKQENYIWYDKENKIYIMNYPSKPRGQEAKFFALRAYTFLLLYNKNNIDIYSLCQEGDGTTKRICEFIKYKMEKNIILPYISNEDIYTDDYNEIDVMEDKVYNRRGKLVYKRNQKIIEKVMRKYNYTCAIHGKNQEYFISHSSKKNYLEGHHLIPFAQESMYRYKGKSVDVEENIIPLCPYCHAKIHYAIKAEKFEIINELFNKKKDDLINIDPNITVYKLAEMYNVYIV